MSNSQFATDPGLAESAPEERFRSGRCIQASQRTADRVCDFGNYWACVDKLVCPIADRGRQCVPHRRACTCPKSQPRNQRPPRFNPRLNQRLPLCISKWLALGPRRDLSFVQRLDAQGYRARVERAATEDETRILIGPLRSEPRSKKPSASYSPRGARDAGRSLASLVSFRWGRDMHPAFHSNLSPSCP